MKMPPIGVLLAIAGVVLLVIGISGIANWETNIGLDAVGVLLLLVGVGLSLRVSTPAFSVGGS